MKMRTSLTSFLLLTCTTLLNAGAFVPVDTDALNEPLPLDATVDGAYHLMDVSASGRYVLLSNFDPAPTASAIPFANTADTCNLYRKDTQTGEITTAFESDEDFSFCAGAKISANGRYVAAAPGQNLPASFCETFTGDVVSLMVRDIESGNISTASKRLELTSSNDIARLCSGGANLFYPPIDLYGLSGNGRVAALRSQQVIGNTVGSVFELADSISGQTENLSPDQGDELASSIVLGVALSRNGNRVAIQTLTSSPCLPDVDCLTEPAGAQPTGPSAILICGQVGRCDQLATPVDETLATTDCQNTGPLDANSDAGCGVWWTSGFEAQPTNAAIQILNRKTATVRRPSALADLPAGTRLQPNAWSRTGKRLSWVEYPEAPLSKCVLDPRIPNPVCTNVGCEANRCELKARTYFLANRKTRTQRTDFDPETLSLCAEYSPTPAASNSVSLGVDCLPKLSNNGNKLLYARAVRYPFGDDWQPDQFGLGDYVCVTRASLETPGFEPEVVDCPPEFKYPDDGPIISINKWDRGTSYSNPVIWYVRNLPKQQTWAVSSLLAGQLFSSSKALISGNGSTLTFQSSDPQLTEPRPELYTPAIVADDSCSWSPPGLGAHIPLATNDNVKVVGEDSLIVYPETPAICAVPEPALRSGVFAGPAQTPVR